MTTHSANLVAFKTVFTSVEVSQDDHCSCCSLGRFPPPKGKLCGLCCLLVSIAVPLWTISFSFPMGPTVAKVHGPHGQYGQYGLWHLGNMGPLQTLGCGHLCGVLRMAPFKLRLSNCPI